MTQGPSGLHQLSQILKSWTPGVVDVHGPHNVFEVMAATPLPMLCACVCSVYEPCMHVMFWRISPLLGPAPFSTQGRRSWQMMNSPKTYSDSCNCSARGIIMVRRKGEWSGEEVRFGDSLEELPELISSFFLP